MFVIVLLIDCLYVAGPLIANCFFVFDCLCILLFCVKVCLDWVVLLYFGLVWVLLLMLDCLFVIVLLYYVRCLFTWLLFSMLWWMLSVYLDLSLFTFACLYCSLCLLRF